MSELVKSGMNKNQSVIFYALIGAKILLGVLFINRLSIDLDEPFSIFHAQKDLTSLNELFIHENNPPMHFWLLHFWIQWFGIDPWAVRSLSLIFSILTLPVLFNLGKNLNNVNTGLGLMALFVFSNFNHSFGIEARGFAIFTFLFSLALLFLIQSIQHKTWKRTLILAFSLALMFYTHYISMVAIPIIILVFFIIGLNRNLKQNLLHTGLILVSILAMIYPLLMTFLDRLNHVSDQGTWVPRPRITELYGLINKFMNGPGFLIILVLFTLFLFFKERRFFNQRLTKARSNVKFLGLLFTILGIYLGAFLLSYFGSNSVFLDRYLFFISIGLYALLAWLVESTRMKMKWLSFALLAAVIFGFNPFKTHNRDSDSLVEYAAQFKGSYIITPPHYDLTFLYHHDKEVFKMMREGDQLHQNHIYPIYNLHEIDLDELRKPIILVDADSRFLYGNQQIKDSLLARYAVKESRIFPGNYEVLVFE